MRIEAASWRGKPVFFRVIGPWSKPERMQEPASALASVLIGLGTVAFSAFLAWRNFRERRGDIRGANRVAAFVYALACLSFLLQAHHVAAVSEVGGALLILGISIFPAIAVWAFYLAFEPYVRRRWPQSMISWSRLLGGGFRDPLVGGHALFGVALGLGLAFLILGRRLAPEDYGPGPVAVQILSILDTRRMVGVLTNRLLATLLQGMLYTFILMLLRVLLRRQWFAAGALVLLFSLANAASSPSHPGIEAALGALSMAWFALALLRFGGLLTSIVCGFVGVMLAQYPLTTDLSAWYASTTIFAVVVVVLAPAAYAFHTAVAGRPLFKAGFLEPN
jgi:hypothetical protein